VVAWSDPNAVGVTLADGTTIFELCFIVRGAVGASSSITFTDDPTPQLFSDGVSETPFVGGSGALTVTNGDLCTGNVK